MISIRLGSFVAAMAGLALVGVGGCGNDGEGGADGSVTADASDPTGDAGIGADADPNAPDGSPSCAAPGSQTCSTDGQALEVCTEQGTATVEGCEFGCGTDPQSGADRCNACAPASTACQGDLLVSCDGDGAIETQNQCALGCNPSGDPSAECYVLEPTNLAANSCDSPTGADLLVASSQIFDTSSLNCTEVLLQLDGPEICVLRVNRFSIASGVTLQVRGARALAVVAAASIDIAGTLDASADHDVPGPGAFGSGIGGSGAADADGGGGAGFGTNGANGAMGFLQGSAAGQRGLTYGTAALAPLVGGSSGGRNGASDEPRGAGGGAIQLVSCGSLTVAGAINAGGGGGAGGISVADGDPPRGGTGGGSGGGILLEAASIDISGIIGANGGGGGGGGLAVDNGIDGSAGNDGDASATPAGGGSGPAEAGAGGAGGAASFAPVSGEAPVTSTGGAGAGGGAIGRVRLNVRAGTSPVVTGTISPISSQGEVGVH